MHFCFSAVQRWHMTEAEPGSAWSASKLGILRLFKSVLSFAFSTHPWGFLCSVFWPIKAKGQTQIIIAGQ